MQGGLSAPPAAFHIFSKREQAASTRWATVSDNDSFPDQAGSLMGQPPFAGPLATDLQGTTIVRDAARAGCPPRRRARLSISLSTTGPQTPHASGFILACSWCSSSSKHTATPGLDVTRARSAARTVPRSEGTPVIRNGLSWFRVYVNAAAALGGAGNAWNISCAKLCH